jgi:hypothetical protein
MKNKIQILPQSKTNILKKPTKLFPQLTIHSQLEQKSVKNKNSSESASFKETKNNKAHNLHFYYFFKN